MNESITDTLKEALPETNKLPPLIFLVKVPNCSEQVL